VILFRADMKQAIIEGRKTVTRRQGKRRWNVGAEHLCYTRPPFAKGGAQPFARVRIVSVTEEGNVGGGIPVTDGSIKAMEEWLANQGAEAHREGFDSWAQFAGAYEQINGPMSMYLPCHRVEFELVEVLEAGA